jgi:hypothetical protein
MDLAPNPGSSRQPLGVIPMAIALTAAAFLGGGLGLLIEGGGTSDAAKASVAEAQPAD